VDKKSQKYQVMNTKINTLDSKEWIIDKPINSHLKSPMIRINVMNQILQELQMQQYPITNGDVIFLNNKSEPAYIYFSTSFQIEKTGKKDPGQFFIFNAIFFKRNPWVFRYFRYNYWSKYLTDSITVELKIPEHIQFYNKLFNGEKNMFYSIFPHLDQMCIVIHFGPNESDLQTNLGLKRFLIPINKNFFFDIEKTLSIPLPFQLLLTESSATYYYKNYN
jgi:hypothetical protein